ncbi:hypothetical protein GR160_18695 [Flavobacterium sp. Sd200]|uniref:hypothetical protein n=1 Tax=Flavobacterium sp. Sd200 TaxID=2692211 RepID=UPI001369B1FB|nr:hypothetical protein [Flavobacterium sp. Sd200]MXN93261.1 hypothetical protein [Flavobacterium sp. Sd200]
MTKKITALKSILAAAALLFMFTTTTVAAQDKDALATLNNYMKEQLSLNESQSAKINEINRAFMQKAKDNEKTSLSKLDKAKKIKLYEEERDKKLQSVLTKDQYKTFIANRAENTKRLKELLPEKTK